MSWMQTQVLTEEKIKLCPFQTPPCSPSPFSMVGHIWSDHFSCFSMYKKIEHQHTNTKSPAGSLFDVDT